MLAYDSVTAGDIPTDAEYVVGWGDLHYQWSAADWARFGHAIRQTLIGDPAHDGDWLDVEDTLASASDCAGWLWRQRERPAWRGGIYTFEDDDGAGHGWPPVKAALRGWTDVRFWIASELQALPSEPPVISQDWLDQGVALWQYAQSPGISPGHFDLSAISPAYLSGLLGPPPAVVPPAIFRR